MAFAVFDQKDRTPRSVLELRGMHRPPEAPQYNLLHRQTAGLQRFHKEIDKAKKEGFDIGERRRQRMTNLKMFMFGGGDNQEENGVLYARYRPVTALGKGTFSQLIVAHDLYDPKKRKVAVKIMNRHCDYIGVQECQKIKLLNRLDVNDETHIVKLMGRFYCGNHFCIVLELLGCSLLHHMKAFPRNRMSIEFIRKIAIQLLASFAFIRNCGVIHADLKPENVLLEIANMDLKNPCHRIKLVDFGNAMTLVDTSAYFDEFQVQSLYYRAPEILLGHWNFGFEIDMWSLGCMLVELYIGTPLFRVRSSEELFDCMIHLLGPLPSGIYDDSKFYSRYVTKKVHVAPNDDILPLAKLTRLQKLLKCNDKHFVSFVASLLEYDPHRRMSPSDAIFHPFFSTLFPFTLVFHPKFYQCNDSDDRDQTATSFSEDSEDVISLSSAGTNRKRDNAHLENDNASGIKRRAIQGSNDL